MLHMVYFLCMRLLKARKKDLGKPGQTFLSNAFYKKSIYLFLTVLHLCCCMGFSLVVASEGYSPVAVCGLLVVVASLVEDHGHYHV